MSVSAQPASLASYASNPANSRGRRYPDVPAPTRNAFQRDRDRVVHSTAFRRLVYKTQVFLNHEGDLFRTRLTHSLEVAQLARSMARTMGLHEDLCEAISLAHDLGHTPFGHAGQDALNECLQQLGSDSIGFEHNFQSLRVVDELEHRYPAFDGLNLCFESREGILKHCSSQRARQLEALEPGGIARRFLDRTQPSLEAQVCNLADEIAYNSHDIDDGVRSGLLTYEQLLEVPAVLRFHRESVQTFPSLRGRRLLYETLRRMLSSQVSDVVEASTLNLQVSMPRDSNAAKSCGPLICFSASTQSEVTSIKALLRRELYRHPSVVQTTELAKQVIHDLFATYQANPAQMPANFARQSSKLQAISDYIAGMTDRFAMREHHRITGSLIGITDRKDVIPRPAAHAS